MLCASSDWVWQKERIWIFRKNTMVYWGLGLSSCVLRSVPAGIPELAIYASSVLWNPYDIPKVRLITAELRAPNYYSCMK